jgi:hypothetical protein
MDPLATTGSSLPSPKGRAVSLYLSSVLFLLAVSSNLCTAAELSKLSRNIGSRIDPITKGAEITAEVVKLSIIPTAIVMPIWKRNNHPISLPSPFSLSCGVWAVVRVELASE